jgi:hypothetical protein
MITSAPEAINLHEKVVNEMWRGAIKGPDAAAHLRSLLTPDDQRVSSVPDASGSEPSETSSPQDVQKDNRPSRRAIRARQSGENP